MSERHAQQATTREPERGPPFKPCAKCEAVQDVALLCGPCADRFCDHLMADPAFAATMACWEDIQRIVEDAERKQAAYAAHRQWWTTNWTRAVQIVDATPHQPVIRTADMQAVVDATNSQ